MTISAIVSASSESTTRVREYAKPPAASATDLHMTPLALMTKAAPATLPLDPWTLWTVTVGDNRPPVYYDTLDGREVMIIRASALGSDCMWELVAHGQGYEPQPFPDNILRAFDEGNELEKIIIQKMKDVGWRFQSHQEEGHLMITEDLYIRYHSDGLAEGLAFNLAAGELTATDAIIEAKALHNQSWQNWIRTDKPPFKEYEWQASVMMHAEDKPLVWAVYNKGLTPDENGVRPPCPDQGGMFYLARYAPPIDLPTIRTRALQIKELVEGDDLIESGAVCDSPKHWPCRFLHLRPEVGAEDSSTPGHDQGAAHLVLGEQDQARVDALVRDYLFHKGQADESKQRYERARDELLAIAGDSKRIVTDKWDVPFVEGTATRLDYSTMPSELKQVLEGHKKKTKYRYIRGIERRD